MTPTPHCYDVHVTSRPWGYAALSTAGVPRLHSAPPAQYDGPGDAWSPEHLLLAAVESCFVFTFRAIARNSKVLFLSIDANASGTVDREGGVTRFTEIVLRPVVTIPQGADRERVMHALEKAEKHCLVAASLATPVRVEANIVEATAAVA